MNLTQAYASISLDSVKKMIVKNCVRSWQFGEKKTVILIMIIFLYLFKILKSRKQYIYIFINIK